MITLPLPSGNHDKRSDDSTKPKECSKPNVYRGRRQDSRRPGPHEPHAMTLDPVDVLPSVGTLACPPNKFGFCNSTGEPTSWKTFRRRIFLQPSAVLPPLACRPPTFRFSLFHRLPLRLLRIYNCLEVLVEVCMRFGTRHGVGWPSELPTEATTRRRA